MEKRPEWYFKNVTYNFARWIYDNKIVKITHHWEMTGADTSKDWEELHSENNEKRTSPRLGNEVLYQPSYKGLVVLRTDVENLVRKIIEWEATHKGKIEQFKKLKDELGL